MVVRVLSATVLAGMVLASPSCAQPEKDDEHLSDVFVVSSDRRAWIGVSVEDMSERLARRMNVSTRKGALVNSVSDDSPAMKAGIKEDDIIVSFNGKAVDDAEDLTRAVGKAKPGTSAECIVMRRNDRKTIQVTPEKPPQRATAWNLRTPRAPRAMVGPGHFSFVGTGVLGLGMMDLNRQLAEYFQVPGGRGVLISEVEKDGPGAKAGLKAGDVIVSMGKDDVDDIDDIHWALGDCEEGDTVTVGYIRKGARGSAVVTVDESPTPKLHRFRSDNLPGFDFDFELEGLKDESLNMKEMQEQIQQELKRAQEEMTSSAKMNEMQKEIQHELQRVQEEMKVKGREAKRQAEQAVQEFKRQLRARTI